MNAVYLVFELGTENAEGTAYLSTLFQVIRFIPVWANENYCNPSIGFSVQLLELLVKTNYF